MGLQEDVKALSVDITLIPEQFRQLVLPQAPERARRAVAVGSVPMPSESLIAALAFLASDNNQDIAKTAADSLANLDARLLEGMGGTASSPAVLHEMARACLAHDAVLEAILTNRNTHDETFHFLARRGKARPLEIIAHNQVRLVRYPVIVEALYFNPESPMAIVARALETCVRQGVDISSIPGHEEIIESVLGVSQGGEEEATEAATEEAADGPGVADDEYRELLKSAMDDSGSGRPLSYQQIQALSIGQKVRLAMMGNQAARGILIKDNRQVVAMAVLRSPRLTDKEIAAFAKNKSLSDQVIRVISRNREWTKLYDVKKSLIQNPKTPPELAMRFVPSMHDRDLRDLARNKEIPSFVKATAARTYSQRQQKRSGGKR